MFNEVIGLVILSRVNQIAVTPTRNRGFDDMDRSREQVSRDIDEALAKVSGPMGGGFRPRRPGLPITRPQDQRGPLAALPEEDRALIRPLLPQPGAQNESTPHDML